jgi:hypothetical protein
MLWKKKSENYKLIKMDILKIKKFIVSNTLIPIDIAKNS